MKGLFFGRATIDLTYLIGKYPQENEKIFAEKSLMQPGGQAQNAAITFSQLGGKSILVSTFGDSYLANFDKKMIKENYAIEIIDIAENRDFEFPVSSVFVNKGNATRTIVNSAKSNSAISKKFGNMIYDDVDFILIDGFNLSNSVLDLMDEYKKLGIKVIMDAGSWKDGMNDYLDKVNIIICSNRFRYPGNNKNETVEYLRSKRIETIAFTNEENPVELFEKEKVVSFEVPRINAIDTLGAGDVLHGSFCFHFAKTGNINTSIELSIKDASKSCQYFGTHTWHEKVK